MTTTSNVDNELEKEDTDDWDVMIARYSIRPLSDAGYLGCAIYLTIVGLIATFGNSTTIIMFSRHKKLRNKPHNMLLINLAISDLGISVFGYPVTTSSCYAGRFLWGLVGCKVQGFSTLFFAILDMATLTVVSVYRWVAVCMPEHNHRLNFWVTMKVIAATWAFVFLITMPPLVGMSRFIFEPFGTSCTIDWDDQSPASVFYVYFLIIIAYFVPVTIMCYCYYKVVMRSKDLIRAMNKARSNTMSLGEAEKANNTLAENKVTWISLIMVLVFVVIWSPYTVVCIWAIYDPTIPVWANTLPTMFAKASCMLNPVIFYLTNPIFRNTFKATFFRTHRVQPTAGLYKAGTTFKVDKTKEGIFIGENSVTFRKAETTLF